MTIYSVFPLKMVIFHSYVSLLEGNDHRPGDEMCELVHVGAVEGKKNS